MKNLDLMELAARTLIEQEDKKLRMESYLSLNGYSVRYYKEENTCHTAACFAGHMPFLGIKELEPIDSDFETKKKYVDGKIIKRFALSYEDYTERLFDLDWRDNEGGWSFIFGPYWPDDKKEILDRVLYLKENKKVPHVEEWYNMGWTG